DRTNDIEPSVVPVPGEHIRRIRSKMPVFVGQPVGDLWQDGRIMKRDKLLGNVTLLPEDVGSLEFLDQGCMSQLARAGSQPSSRRAFAFEPARTCVIMTTRCSPAASRITQAGTTRGRFAPSKVASSGSHVRTCAGSSSTML